eukprot:6180452-Lingulodinium_polyedra.AAC.1
MVLRVSDRGQGASIPRAGRPASIVFSQCEDVWFGESGALVLPLGLDSIWQRTQRRSAHGWA